jgi:hypothetical protein
MRWFWGSGIAMVLAVASACGGGEKAAPSLSDADLKAIVMMTSEGLPWTLVPQSDSAVSNEESAQPFADPTKWLDNYRKWGRTGGHMATFGVTGGNVVQAQVESYESAGGAKKALAGVRDFMISGEALHAYANLGYTDVKIEVMDAAKIGDDSSAYRLVVSMNGTPFDTLVIMFRRGAVLAQASVGAAPDTTGSADVEALANQMDARIRAVLSGQAATPQSN